MKKSKKVIALLLSVSMLGGLVGCGAKETSAKSDLNKMTLDEITAQAKQEGTIESVGMPDDWANWGQTWSDILTKYGIKHNDQDMSSTEELALFEAEKSSPTKDIGDVGQSFTSVAVEKGLAQPYKTTTWDSIPDWAKDKDGNWVIAYVGTISFITNKEKVANAPKSWEDILDGNYKVTVGDPAKASASQCAVLSAALAFGGDVTNIQPGLDFFNELAKAGRLDIGDASQARLEKGEIEVMVTWDYLSLAMRDSVTANNSSASLEVSIPTDGACQSGYSTIINKYAPHPCAAALAREYILSDEGQTNLARGYAKPIRDVQLPEDVKAKLLPEDQYTNVTPIEDFAAWTKTVTELATKWQDDVLPNIK